MPGKEAKREMPKNAETDLDGLYVDEQNDRTIHLGWDSDTTIYIDVFDTATAAFQAEFGNSLASVLVNVVTGDVSIKWSSKALGK